MSRLAEAWFDDEFSGDYYYDHDNDEEWFLSHVAVANCVIQSGDAVRVVLEAYGYDRETDEIKLMTPSHDDARLFIAFQTPQNVVWRDYSYVAFGENAAIELKLTGFSGELTNITLGFHRYEPIIPNIEYKATFILPDGGVPKFWIGFRGCAEQV